MMKKFKILILCIPLYFLHLIGEWYFINTTLIGKKFSFKKETKEYWKEFYTYMKSK